MRTRGLFMKSSATIHLGVRILVFLGLWLVAGIIWAAFSDFSLENGESRFAVQFLMVLFGPVMAAQGLAFAIVPGGYRAWPNRQTWEASLCVVFLLLFLAHGLITL